MIKLVVKGEIGFGKQSNWLLLSFEVQGSGVGIWVLDLARIEKGAGGSRWNTRMG